MDETKNLHLVYTEAIGCSDNIICKEFKAHAAILLHLQIASLDIQQMAHRKLLQGSQLRILKDVQG